MRRLSLSTKLFAAALPLVIAVGALLALTVRSDLAEVHHAERGADLGAVWTPLVAAINAVETELDGIPPHPEADPSGAVVEVDPAVTAHLTEVRRATDQSLTALADKIAPLGSAEASRKHITQAKTDLSGARRAIDMASVAPGMSTDIDPIVAYNSGLRELVSIGQLLPAESGDAQLGRELLAVVKLAEARIAADAVAANVKEYEQDVTDPSPLATAQVRYTEIESVMNEFSAIAPEEWAKQFRQSGYTTALSKYRFQLDAARRAAESGASAEFDLDGFRALSDQSLDLQKDITGSIVDRAQALAETTRKQALVRTLIALSAVLLAALIAMLLTRSVTRRVKTVSKRANQVATEQLPALVEAIRDPRGKAVLPEVKPINTRGNDELAELARSFNTMQSTLVDVAHEQVEVLRRGVSDIFITMARRNRSLIDRQLAMLDEFEAEVDDPEVLSNYYQLDHMATRMRRSSESLLVLANADPKRRRVKATEIDDVVRAAIGEVEDYRRIEVEALEHLQVRGNVVADVSHLLAELLDNATSFSPPDSTVRLGGRRAGDSYIIRIVDSGVGITGERLTELNELLREPPIVGLSVEPTLGMSVVSLLAARHGVTVTLSHSSPGTTVDVLLPSSMFGPIDEPAFGPTAAAAAPPRLADEPTTSEPFEPYEPDMAWAEAAMADEDIEPTLPTTPVMPLVVAETVLDHVDHTVEPVVPIVPSRGGPSIAGEPLIERHIEADVAPSWAGRSFDFSDAREQSSLEAQAMAEIEQPAWYADEPVDETTEIRLEDSLDHFTSPSLPSRGEFPSLPASAPDTPAPAPFAPPTFAAPTAEFDRVPAPPVGASSLTQRPVTPSDAMPPATVRLPAPVGPGLPTRTPSRGPEGPDRMAASSGSVMADAPVAPTSSPSALQAALTAFDTRRSGPDSLPTRDRSASEPAPPGTFDEPASIAQSRLDPEVLRERLRAFQSEFRTATTGGTETDQDHSSHDLGGDRR
jgi:signal transduction histidine kinase